MFRQFWIGLFVMMFASSVQAADATDAVRGFADQLASQALAIVKDTANAQDQKQEKLEVLFKESVDIPWVAKFVLGKNWHAATPAQQQDYLTNYETFVLKNYTSKLTAYTGQGYKITSVREEEGGDAKSKEYALTMELISSNEPAVIVDYRIRQNGKGYKIFDIVVEGVSMITTQRSEFSSVVSNKGLDFLIGALKQKAAAAAATAAKQPG